MRDRIWQQLDDLLDVDAFADGQVNGLQIEGKAEVQRVMGAVSVNQESIDAAVAWGADAMLTHHGLLWNKEPRHMRGVQRRRMQALLAADMNLYSYHLPLDAHVALGNNAYLAKQAGLTNWEPAFGQPTIGVVGQLQQSFQDWMPNFTAAVKQGCGVETGPIHVWDFGPEHIDRIGFVSGAAPYLVQDAIDMGLDAFVTGEVTEPAYHLAKEAGIHFIALGHYLSERGGVLQLLEQLEVETAFIDVETKA